MNPFEDSPSSTNPFEDAPASGNPFETEPADDAARRKRIKAAQVDVNTQPLLTNENISDFVGGIFTPGGREEVKTIAPGTMAALEAPVAALGIGESAIDESNREIRKAGGTVPISDELPGFVGGLGRVLAAGPVAPFTEAALKTTQIAQNEPDVNPFAPKQLLRSAVAGASIYGANKLAGALTSKVLDSALPTAAKVAGVAAAQLPGDTAALESMKAAEAYGRGEDVSEAIKPTAEDLPQLGMSLGAGVAGALGAANSIRAVNEMRARADVTGLNNPVLTPEKAAQLQQQLELEVPLVETLKGTEALRRQELTNEFVAATKAGDTEKAASLEDQLRMLKYENNTTIRGVSGEVPTPEKAPPPPELVDRLMVSAAEPKFTEADLDKTRIATPEEGPSGGGEAPKLRLASSKGSFAQPVSLDFDVRKGDPDLSGQIKDAMQSAYPDLFVSVARHARGPLQEMSGTRSYTVQFARAAIDKDSGARYMGPLTAPPKGWHKALGIPDELIPDGEFFAVPREETLTMTPEERAAERKARFGLGLKMMANGGEVPLEAQAATPERKVIQSELPTREAEGQTPSEVVPSAQAGTASPQPQRQEGIESGLGGSSALEDQPKYIGSLNVKRFADQDAGLQKQMQAMETSRDKPETKTHEQIVAGAEKIEPFTTEQLKSYGENNVGGMSAEKAHALSRQYNEYNRRLNEGMLSDADMEHLVELNRVENLRAHKLGADLNARKIELDRMDIEGGNWKSLAVRRAAEIFGKDVPKEVLDSINKSDNSWESQAETLFRESRKTQPFINNLVVADWLSNPTTLGTNFVSQSANMFLDGLLSSGKAPMLKGAVESAGESWRRGVFAAKKGYRYEEAKNLETGKASGFAAGGIANPFNTIPRLMLGTDEFMRTMATGAYARKAARQAALNALGGDAEPEAIESFIKDYIQNIPADVKEQIDQHAAQSIYQGDPPEGSARGKLDRGIQALRDWYAFGENKRWGLKPGRILLAFYKTPKNVIAEGAKYTPAGLAIAPFSNRPVQTAAKAIIGTMFTAPFVAMYEAGNLTGSLPSDPKERDAFLGSGMQPNSFRLSKDGRWFPNAWLGPLIGQAAIATAFGDAYKKKDRGELDGSVWANAAANAAENMLNSTPLPQLATYMDAMFNSEGGNTGKAERALSSLASGFNPLQGTQTFVNKLTDPYIRDPLREQNDTIGNIGGRILAGSAIGRAKLPPRVTPLGDEVKRPGLYPVGEEFSSPVYAEAYRLGVDVPAPSSESPMQSPDRFKKQPQMSAEEMRNVRLSAAPMASKIAQFIQSERYQSLPDDKKRLALYTVLHDPNGLSAITQGAKWRELQRRPLPAGAL